MTLKLQTEDEIQRSYRKFITNRDVLILMSSCATKVLMAAADERF